MANEKQEFSVLNWASTIVGIALGGLALVSQIKDSGKGDAIQEQLQSQTQKQWELRQ